MRDASPKISPNQYSTPFKQPAKSIYETESNHLPPATKGYDRNKLMPPVEMFDERDKKSKRAKSKHSKRSKHSKHKSKHKDKDKDKKKKKDKDKKKKKKKKKKKRSSSSSSESESDSDSEEEEKEDHFLPDIAPKGKHHNRSNHNRHDRYRDREDDFGVAGTQERQDRVLNKYAARR